VRIVRASSGPCQFVRVHVTTWSTNPPPALNAYWIPIQRALVRASEPSPAAGAGSSRVWGATWGLGSNVNNCNSAPAVGSDVREPCLEYVRPERYSWPRGTRLEAVAAVDNDRRRWVSVASTTAQESAGSDPSLGGDFPAPPITSYLRRVRLSSLILAACCALCGACGSTVLDVGVPRPTYKFGTPRQLTELDTSYANQNPTLTADLLELFFTSGRADNSGDVWTAKRTSPTNPFDAPAIVSEVSTSSFETSPAVTLDGLTLYYGSDRSGGVGEVDIWQVTRPDRSTSWADITNVAALNSSAKDIPRPLGQHDLVMPMGSQRDSSVGYQTFLAARPAITQPFARIDLVSGLASDQEAVADGFLTGDGLTLFYSVTPPNAPPDLFMATRATTAQPFSQPSPLRDLNTDADERDPWLSPDGSTFFFSSDRGGNLQIYEVPATVLQP